MCDLVQRAGNLHNDPFFPGGGSQWSLKASRSVRTVKCALGFLSLGKDINQHAVLYQQCFWESPALSLPARKGVRDASARPCASEHKSTPLDLSAEPVQGLV